MEHPLVTIVMPTFNRAHLLSRAINSVLNQSYTNWELIVVDDCSTDDTEQVVRKYYDDRIIFVRNNANLGGSGSRNVGLRMARGKLISFLDSDDEYLPNKIQRQAELFNNSDISNLGIITCGRHDVRDSKIYFTWIPTYRGNVIFQLLSKKRVGAGTPFLMIKREVLEAGIEFDPLMPAGQDWDFVVRVCQLFNMDYVAEPLVLVHHHDGERIYNHHSALAALDKQYEKFKDKLTQYPLAHRRFILKRAALHFSYGDRNMALQLTENPEIKRWGIGGLWKWYFSIFQNIDSLPSRVFLKVLNLVTFSRYAA
jgi:glycosyltransferase involved in cell wall biosynthesis